MAWIRNYFASNSNIFTTSFIKFLLAKLKAIIEEFDDSIYLEGMNLGANQVPTKQAKDQERQSLIVKIMSGDIGSLFVQGSDLVKD